MSTPPTAHDPRHPQTTSSPPFAFAHTSESLHYAVNHVFFPVHPDFRCDTPANRHSLARAVCAAAHAYAIYVSGSTEQAQWHRIAKMLDNLQAYVQSEDVNPDHVISQLRGMETGGM